MDTVQSYASGIPITPEVTPETILALQPVVRVIPALQQKVNSFQSPCNATRLPDRQISTCQALGFEPPETYEEKARGNMKAFLENNFYKQSSCELSSIPPVSAWLSSEQVQLLSNSCEGEMLLMLINDIDLFATECIGKEYCSQEYKKPEKLPFEFSSDKNVLLKRIRQYFSRLVFTAIKVRRGRFGENLEPCEDQNLTMIDIINYERLLVKIMVFISRDIEKFDLSCESLLVDFKRTVALGEKSEFYNLVNLTDKAFETWLDMQSSFYKAIRGEVYYKDTQIIAGANRFLWSFCDHGVVSPGHIASRQKEILNYLMFFLIPDQVLPLLFSKSITSTEKTAVSATAKESLKIEMQAHKDFKNRNAKPIKDFSKKYEY